MMKQKKGSIINIGSNYGSVGVSQFSAYCVSKAAVIHLSRVLAVEWAKEGIRVNTSALQRPGPRGPGSVLTIPAEGPLRAPFSCGPGFGNGRSGGRRHLPGIGCIRDGYRP